MPTFITIGYGDREGYDRTPVALREAAHAEDARLRDAGCPMGAAGEAVRVSNHPGAGPDVRRGPFMRADLPVAGFAVIEAEDIGRAVEIASRAPCAVAYGVVEVWPLDPGAASGDASVGRGPAPSRAEPGSPVRPPRAPW